MRKNKTIQVQTSVARSTESHLGVRGLLLPFRLAFGVFVLFVVTYLYVINQNAVQGFAVRGAEKTLAAAKDENQRLRIEEAQLRSLGRIMDAKESLGLVETTPDNKAVSFLSLGGSLAFR